MDVRIFQPPKNAMQSGRAKTKQWILEFTPLSKRRPDDLIGWVGGSDTREQLRMSFPTKEQAIAFAEKNNLTYSVKDANPRKLIVKSYADNFAFDRII